MAKILLSLVLLGLLAGPLRAQSNDVEYPTPVRENTIEGRIVPRDIGDARLTRHFYAFTGTPGEMFLRIASANLEGDVDLFIANGLRPLLKVSLLAGGTSTTVNKTAYVKRREALILRVEARTPDDQPGAYKINFSGAFEVFGGPERTAPVIASATPENRPAVRVNSAGARLDPLPTPTPKPTPAPVVAKVTPPRPARAPKPAPTPVATTATLPKPPKPVEPKPAPSPKPTPVATAKTPAPRPARPARQPKPTAPKPETTAPPAPKTVTPRPAATPPPAKPKPPPKAKPPIVQTHLVLEFKNGSSISREAVRRVTIEKGEVVVVTAEGKIERYSLVEITKMSVEPAVIQP